MTTVALTADLQFASQPRYSTLAPSGVSTRLEDACECFRWIVEKAIAESCDALFLLGDVLDSRTVIDVPVIDRVCRLVAEASEQLDVHVLVGNHDAFLRSARINSTQMFRGNARVHEKVCRIGQFVLVPWTDEPAAFEHLLRRAERLRKRSPHKQHYLLTHGMFEGAVPMAKGMPLEWLTRGGWSKVFLGDVHDPVVLHEASPFIRYVGSPMQLHFGDSGGRRGFVILEVESGQDRYVTNSKSPRFHVIGEDGDPEAVKTATERDFFRIKATDPDVSAKLAEKARKLSPWVEVETPNMKITAISRVQAAATLTDDKLLVEYCKQVSSDPELLVPVGLDIMKEARS